MYSVSDSVHAEILGLERRFMLPGGSINLLMMSDHLSGAEFRRYIELSRMARGWKRRSISGNS